MTDNKPRTPRSGAPRTGLAEEVMGLDEEVIRLLARRSALMRKLRGGKRLASTPAASELEKRLRRAWESKAGGLSHSPRFIRDLFELIQALDLHALQEENAPAPFNLAPARLPVAVDLPGPVRESAAQLWLALASATGGKILLQGLSRTDGLQDSIRAFTWCGMRAAWQTEEQGETLEISGPAALEFHQGGILVGEDPLTLYLLVFLGLNRPGRIRFVGGPRLKTADLSALAHLVPSLGARLAWVVPGSRGLPITLECSGVLPESLEIPAGLPPEAVSALILAGLAWPSPPRLGLQALSPETRAQALEPLRPLLDALPKSAPRTQDAWLEFPRMPPELPARVSVDLDPALCAFWLCLPLFAGGRTQLRGTWPDSSPAREVSALLARLPLAFQAEKNRVLAAAAPEKGWPERLELEDMNRALHPLFWVLNARLVHKSKLPAVLRVIPRDADTDLAEEFLAQAGFALALEEQDWRIRPLEEEAFKERAAKKHGWSSPDAGWALALSLAAFLRANLKLNNPECVPAVWPDYWQYYNTLPAPRPRRAETPPPPPPAAPARRRIMAADAPGDPEAQCGNSDTGRNLPA